MHKDLKVYTIIRAGELLLGFERSGRARIMENLSPMVFVSVTAR